VYYYLIAEEILITDDRYSGEWYTQSNA
jgi:hypothetical protein